MKANIWGMKKQSFRHQMITWLLQHPFLILASQSLILTLLGQDTKAKWSNYNTCICFITFWLVKPFRFH